jgi:hypothetical protein
MPCEPWSGGACSASSSRPPSTAAERRQTAMSATTAAIGYASSQWRDAAKNAVRAPSEPASVATVLYVPKSAVTVSSAAAWGSIACSSDVNGPDSTMSTETVPVSAAATSAGKDSVSANTSPAAAIATSSERYARRRPIRSPYRARTIDARATPASIAVNTTPTRVDERPDCSRETPMTMLPSP